MTVATENQARMRIIVFQRLMTGGELDNKQHGGRRASAIAAHAISNIAQPMTEGDSFVMDVSDAGQPIR